MNRVHHFPLEDIRYGNASSYLSLLYVLTDEPSFSLLRSMITFSSVVITHPDVLSTGKRRHVRLIILPHLVHYLVEKLLNL